MLNDITLGQYFPGNSVIHRMDPRMKLILTILYIVGVFIVANLPGYAIALAFLYIVVRISGIKFRIWRRASSRFDSSSSSRSS